MKGGRRHHEVEGSRFAGPILERGEVELDVREVREVPLRDREQRTADVERDEPIAALRERPRGLPRAAADLEDPRRRRQRGERDDVVEERAWVPRARGVVVLGAL